MTKLLDPDAYRRDAWPPLPGVSRRVHDPLVFGALIAVALGLVVASKLEAAIVGVARTAVQDAASPVLRRSQMAARPALEMGRMMADWRTLAETNARLRDENERLRGWEARARLLEQQTSALNEMVRVVAEPQVGFATARVISGAGGPFVRSGLLDAGRDHGLKAGYPVMSAQGLAGRVLTVGTQSARILLVTDYNSRIPVVIGKDAARAVMQGDNGPLPRIAYLPRDSAIQPGDDVFTSGVGGLFPRGLRVGTVVDTGDALRIEPVVRFDRLDYVSVLFFEPISASLADEERAIEARASTLKRLGPSWPTSAEGGVAR
jgi:rod shape-determining protein MreC